MILILLFTALCLTLALLVSADVDASRAMQRVRVRPHRPERRDLN
ncbi:MAG TPA: hypothetical protein VG936_03465 [Lacunisphaera sp.]|nr:hypothetical protein [Lacunisphaera sp.]